MYQGWRCGVVGGGLGIFLLGLGFVGGITAERVRFEYQRTAALNPSDGAAGRWDGHGMQIRQKAPEGADTAESPWIAPLRRVDDALARKDVSAAERAWHEAYGEALRSRHWEGMLAVGDATLRIGNVVGSRQAPAGKARRLYLAALFRARDQGSLEGVLRTAEAFAALGDREVVYQSVRIAEGLTAQRSDGDARARLHALAESMTGELVGAKGPRLEP
ncbi:MAG: hypothetical protein HYT85_02820 [candidate division NC10 bacterium]|nr:hypothetical protein [candidate division NC10 bacterium]